MNELILILVCLAVGYFTGIATGLFGIGGGVIYVPSLFFLLELINIPGEMLPYIVIATSLFAGSFGSTSAFIDHFRRANVDVKNGLILGSGSVLAALIVPHIVVDFSPTSLKIILSFVLFLVAVRMFVNDSKTTVNFNLNRKYLFFLGILVGSISAITGLGGGILFVPILLYLFSYEIRISIGSSTLAVALTMIFCSVSYALMTTDLDQNYLQLGYINVVTGFPLGVGAILGSKLGVKLIFKYNPVVIKRLFSLLLLLVIIKIITSI